MRGMRGDQSGQQVDDLARRAEQLASEQQEFQNQLRQLLRKPDVAGWAGETFGATREQIDKSRQMAGQRDKMAEELARIEREMQQTARDLAASQRAASSKVRSALGNMQQNEIGTRMRYNSGLLRQGYGPYVVPREQPITQGLNELRDQLREAQGTLGRNPAGQNSSEQALARIEQMRNRLQQLAQGRSGQQQNGQRGEANQQGRAGDQAGRQQGQGGRGQQQDGQQGGQQGGQQAGNQQGGQRGGQQGGNQQGGQRGGGGGGQRGGSLYRDGERQFGQQGGPNQGWDRSAMNRGDLTIGPIPSPMRVDREEASRVYQDSFRDLTQLRQSLADNPQAAADVQDLLRELAQLDPSRFADNALLLDRIKSVILPSIEQLEVQMRRQLDDQQGADIPGNTSFEPRSATPTWPCAPAVSARLSRGK